MTGAVVTVGFGVPVAVKVTGVNAVRRSVARPEGSMTLGASS